MKRSSIQLYHDDRIEKMATLWWQPVIYKDLGVYIPVTQNIWHIVGIQYTLVQ